MNLDILNNIKNGIFIECGANDGIHRSTCLILEKKLNWTGYNIEPNPYCFKQLKNNRKNCININKALSDNNNSTFFKIIEGNRGKLSGNGKISKNENDLKIECITYKKLIEKNNIKKIDFFSLDVEGHEENVLKGMIGCSVFPIYWLVEHNHSNKNNLQNKILKLGYKLLKEDEYDFLFVKK